MTPAQLMALALEEKASLAAAQVVFNLGAALFPQQLPFAADGSRYQTAVTPRRAGKTYATAAKLLSVARAKPGGVALYITLSRVNAKRIVWRVLQELNARFSLGGRVSEGDLCIALPNGSRVLLAGANDNTEVEKFRGMPISVAVIDEAQSFPPYLEALIDEVLEPALTDFNGSIALIGTPGPVPVGYFYRACRSDEWAHHNWSVFDNIHLERKSGKTIRSMLEATLRRRGITEDDPIIRREWFGEWCLDVNSLVFAWNAGRNAAEAPTCRHHVLGIDFGFDDSDALAVLGWNDDSPAVYLVYEWVGAKQSISQLMARVSELHGRYKPLAVVADTGGLGKKIADELQRRTRVPVEAADKARKLEHIELLNDALRAGRFFAPADSRFASDCLMVEWNRDNPEKPKIGDRFHSDILDAALYAYMRCLAWLHTPPPEAPPAPHTLAWLQAQQDATMRQMEEEFEREASLNRQRQQDEVESLLWEYR